MSRVTTQVTEEECERLRDLARQYSTYKEAAKHTQRKYQTARYHMAGECSHWDGDSAPSGRLKPKSYVDTECLDSDSANEIAEKAKGINEVSWVQVGYTGITKSFVSITIQKGHRQKLASILEDYQARAKREWIKDTTVTLSIHADADSPHRWSERKRKIEYWRRRYADKKCTEIDRAADKAELFIKWLNRNRASSNEESTHA